MGLFTPGKGAVNRRFSYEPRFYNPEKDERLRRKMRIRSKVGRRRSPLGLIIFTILLVTVLFVYLNFG